MAIMRRFFVDYPALFERAKLEGPYRQYDAIALRHSAVAFGTSGLGRSVVDVRLGQKRTSDPAIVMSAYHQERTSDPAHVRRPEDSSRARSRTQARPRPAESISRRYTSFTFLSGRLRIGLPVAAKRREHGCATTQIVGSPTPPRSIGRQITFRPWALGNRMICSCRS